MTVPVSVADRLPVTHQRERDSEPARDWYLDRTAWAEGPGHRGTIRGSSQSRAGDVVGRLVVDPFDQSESLRNQQTGDTYDPRRWSGPRSCHQRRHTERESCHRIRHTERSSRRRPLVSMHGTTATGQSTASKSATGPIRHDRVGDRPPHGSTTSTATSFSRIESVTARSPPRTSVSRHPFDTNHS